MAKKRIIAIAIVAIVLSGGYGYYLYNKPRATAESTRTDVTTDARTLYGAFEQDEPRANGMYLNKMIEVKGKVQRVDTSAGNMVILLETGGAGNINCSMASLPSPAVLNQEIVVKGTCAGYLLDVNLVDCIIKENQ
ncbi:OB-fold protein [Flavihumibacter solisilvae]|uniref:Uncharacterized protein n=1 Tax=Flavihumibacter solisilvae TaxID=1349421 RepID=A0A0C1IIU7_9BACT|nr:hypothetical protein [Flavihumibacter solisilvae]KIC94120.1 hypothetical protein OI18_14085 [Flavihumibacter solisilvae]